MQIAMPRKFYQEVDKRSREEMIWFLRSHEKYEEFGAKNGKEGRYANNVRIPNLNVPQEIEEKLFCMLGDQHVYRTLHWLIDDFKSKHDNHWIGMFEGRSGGHFVLYWVNTPDDITCANDDDTGVQFEQWSTCKLRERVKLVQDFDKLTDNVITTVIALSKEYEKTYIRQP